MSPIDFANQRLDAILDRPRMWGGAEAVELQVLLLLELLVNEAFPEPLEPAHEWLMRRYLPFVRTVTSSNTPWLLSGHSANVNTLALHLASFRGLVSSEIDCSAREILTPGP